MKKLTFDCGCSFNTLGETSDGRPRVDWTPDFNTLNYDCSDTWDLISSGNTVGVFQLESRLGSSLAKRLKPTCMEHLAGLAAIIRPGCLDAEYDGKSITHHYIDKKNGDEETECMHDALSSTLEPTYMEIIYQESIMKIAKDVAGFTPEQANDLRKAIGKKNVEKLGAMREEFVANSAATLGEAMATQLFDMIEKSGRYSFNKSHSVSYAINSYMSAYIKTHFPLQFYAAYLNNAQHGQKPFEKIRQLVRDAKENDVYVSTPNLSLKNKNFHIHKDLVYYGLSSVKGIGERALEKLFDAVDLAEEELGVSLKDMAWMDVIRSIYFKISHSVMEILIQSGAFDYLGLQRQFLMYEISIVKRLTKRQRIYFLKFSENTLAETLQTMYNEGVGRDKSSYNKKQHGQLQDYIVMLASPPMSSTDTARTKAAKEMELLGLPISCLSIDDKMTTIPTHDIGDFTMCPGVATIKVIVERLKEHVDKKGNTMAFVSVMDGTGTMDVTIFSRTYDECRDDIYENAELLLTGKPGRDKKMIVETVETLY